MNQPTCLFTCLPLRLPVRVSAKSATTVKFSTGRGGLVVNAGVDASASGFARDDSFDTVDEEFCPQGGSTTTAAAASAAGCGLGSLGRQPSAFSDGFSRGGEDGGEGFWERQYDPASGMAYYLNDNVGLLPVVGPLLNDELQSTVAASVLVMLC